MKHYKMGETERNLIYMAGIKPDLFLQFGLEDSKFHNTYNLAKQDANAVAERFAKESETIVLKKMNKEELTFLLAAIGPFDPNYKKNRYSLGMDLIMEKLRAKVNELLHRLLETK